MNATLTLPRRLLGIWAHPDDEAYLSAGLMARVVDAGGQVTCVFATAGEHGTDDPTRWPPARLARRRRREARRALRRIGVTDVRFLGYGDGACAAADPSSAAARVAAIVDDVLPDTIVTFGPDGITGHPDHRAVSSWATAARDALDDGRWGLPHLLYATTTERFLEEHADLHDRIGLFDLFGSEGPRPTPQDEVAFEVALGDGELDRKRAVLAAHATQTAPLAARVGEAAYRRWLAVESFRLPIPTEVAADSRSGAMATAPSPRRSPADLVLAG